MTFPVVLIFFVVSFGALVQVAGEVQNYMINCLQDIAIKHFPQSRTLVISHSYHKSDDGYVVADSLLNLDYDEPYFEIIVNKFNELQTWPLLLFELDDENKEIEISRSKHGSYILVSERREHADILQDISHQVKRLKNNWEWNPRAYFVIIVTEFQTDDSQQLASDIFAELWIPRIVNVIALISKFETNSTAVLDVYTWFPYNPPGRCPDVIDAVLLDNCVSDNKADGHLVYNASLFPQKIPKDLNGCPLMTSTFELPPMVMKKKLVANDPQEIIFDEGLEVRILKELARSTNSSIIYRGPAADGELWGFDVGNGSWTGITGEVQRSYSDVAMDSLWSRSHLIKDIEDSRPYLIDTVRWFIACAKPYPRWLSIPRVFKASLWIGFLLAYIIVSLVMWLVVKVSYKVTNEEVENQAYISLPKCLLNFWAIILEESASNNPPHVPAIRTVFLVWVLYCWAINTVYQTFLTTFLIDPGLQHQISSEDELLDSGIDYGLETGIIYLLSIDVKNRYRKSKNCDDTAACIERIGTEGDLAFLFSKYLMEYIIAVKYLDADANPKVCDLDEDFAINFIIMVFPKGFPLKEYYDNVLIHLMQAGIVNRWWQDIKYLAILEVAGKFNLPAGEYITLSMEHLQSAFYFLLLGYVLSIVSFFIELIWRRKKL